jgi:hypothetical protein
LSLAARTGSSSTDGMDWTFIRSEIASIIFNYLH